MAFSSVQFLFFFLPLTLAVYYLLPRRARNGVLACFSVLFFLWAGVRYTLLLLVFSLLHWLAGLALCRSSNRKPLLAAVAAADIALLALFKYAGWMAETVNGFFPELLPVLRPALPLGLSFYLFAALGYCADIASGKTGAERSPLRFFLFLAFFGHGPSGPIVRYGQQAPFLDAGERAVTPERFCYGIKRFLFGLAKKTLLADQLALIHMRVTSVPAAELPGPILALGYTAYMMQLYFDFSGYSDMAIGLGEFFGLELPENFDYPYMASTVGDFWRRWHMTLCGWFRTYVYIPLGGSHVSLLKTCRNLLIVFLLTGLWHGAAWQYVAFGLYHGLLLCLERLFLSRVLQKLPYTLGHLYTLAAVWVGMFLFGAPGLRQGLAALYGVFSQQTGEPGYTLAAFADTKLLLLLAASVLLCGPVQALFPKLKQHLLAKAAPGIPGMAFLLVLFFFSIMRVTAGSYNAFIYFQF